MTLVNDLMKFIDNSPVSFNVINNAKSILLENGFKELDEKKNMVLEKGKKYFLTRNGTSLIAFKIGDNIDENYGFNLVASHSDSPCFKVKPEFEKTTDIYNKINIEPYGGMICSSWIDRPLSLAGRVIYNENSTLKTKIISLKKELLMIPNVCIHFNRNVNNGYIYDMAKDMQAFIGQKLSKDTIKKIIAKEVGCDENNIINFDLYLYNTQKALLWGVNNEYISSPRLDDLECVYTSLRGFIDSNHDKNINVLTIFDNEEVGSSSRQGADSDFLDNILLRINNSLGYNHENYMRALSSSFMISADNAHAVHPNFPNLTDETNRVYMNEGIVIKFNASQSYTSDGFSSSLLQKILKEADVPYQFFTNRSDIRGGSTLGNIATRHTSILMVDIGLAQLAMHSSYETAGSKDIEYAYKAFKKFYGSHFVFNQDEVVIE